MKKFSKKDHIFLSIIIVSFLIMVMILTKGTYLYGSSLDWSGQHYSIPEYFRTLFYDTLDPFPDFALNIGSGQNIYNLSYYGLLSPVILISYLFPWVSMSTYISVSSIILLLVSSMLMYKFLHRKKYSSEVCFLATLIFTFATSISFHSHRHIMFMNYMPFLILGLFGVDKKYDTNKGWLLTLSVFLMIMTSYYYSIGGIACLMVYGLYRYLNHMNKVTIKSFFKTLFTMLGPIIVAILASSIITIPTLATIVYNRADSNITITLKDLLLPSINTKNLMYNTYGLGLSAIAIPALINIFKKNKANITLGIILVIFVIFNIMNYILNGTMYIDAKSMIPLLPMYIFVIAEFLKDIFDKKIKFNIIIPITIIISLLIIRYDYMVARYLTDILLLLIAILIFYKTDKKLLFIIPIFLFTIINSYFSNQADTLVLRYTTEENNAVMKESIDLITETDDTFYRVSNDTSKSETTNHTYENINYYNSTIYSSISNQTYNKFYYDTLTNNMAHRNRALTVTTPNIISLMLTNNKYIITRNTNLHGYERLTSSNGLNIYKSDNVMPLGFATSNVMSYETFEKLTDQIKQEALLNVIVADTETKNDFLPSTTKIILNYSEILNDESVTLEDDNSLTIDATNNTKISYELPKEYKNKILFIRFKMNNSYRSRDLSISINGVKNKLTATSWKYYNGNEVFDYVLASEEQDKLVFTFEEGKYNISDFETYILDYAAIENASKKVDKLIVDKEQTKGDKIIGKVNVINDGYFMLTIPYDKGFKIKVDDKVVDYELVDNAFIGFKIEKGTHDIEVTYQAPLKNISLGVSIFGMIMFGVITILESKRKF